MPRITASWARNKVMWLVRLNGAVSQRPGGTFNCAPPFFPNFEIAETALSKASVLIVKPSPTPPKSVRLKAMGRSLGIGLAGGAPKTRKPPTMFLCQRKTDAKAAIQSTVKRVLWEVRTAGTQRRRSSLWWWKRPSVEVSTILRNGVGFGRCRRIGSMETHGLGWWDKEGENECVLRKRIRFGVNWKGRCECGTGSWFRRQRWGNNSAFKI